ncbi:MAG TPA: DnaA regulatory inactivator Hda [Gammaproteobacteria bacterium]
MNAAPQQLTLGISLGSDLDFRLFVPGANEAVVQALRDIAHTPQFIWLWSDASAGRTHLLHAACRDAADNGRRTGLLPLGEATRWRPGVLEGWDALDVVALDDIDAVAGKRDWEQALFSLYNGLRDAGRSLLVTARRPPAGLAFALADLKSRCGAMLVYQLHGLDDEGRLDALTRKAKARGMELPEETGRYLLARVSRDMRDLAALLDRLDRASLTHQRRLTVPFVRDQLDAVSR